MASAGASSVVMRTVGMPALAYTAGVARSRSAISRAACASLLRSPGAEAFTTKAARSSSDSTSKPNAGCRITVQAGNLFKVPGSYWKMSAHVFKCDAMRLFGLSSFGASTSGASGLGARSCMQSPASGHDAREAPDFSRDASSASSGLGARGCVHKRDGGHDGRQFQGFSEASAPAKPTSSSQQPEPTSPGSCAARDSANGNSSRSSKAQAGILPVRAAFLMAAMVARYCSEPWKRATSSATDSGTSSAPRGKSPAPSLELPTLGAWRGSGPGSAWRPPCILGAPATCHERRRGIADCSCGLAVVGKAAAGCRCVEGSACRTDEGDTSWSHSRMT
mmetsp:Transcript_42280/g.122698  ORF Transcript_42280/g.122698 Transcript_42280/m.122698 type:complete len:335 (+) Transcript_42280:172-1176(+)